MELKGPPGWKKEIISERSSKIDPSIIEEVRKSALGVRKNRKGEEYFKLTKYDAYVKHELAVIDEDIPAFIQANGLKPSQAVEYKDTYEGLQKKLLEKGMDAIVQKKGEGGSSSHVFIFRGGDYEGMRYYDFYDAQRNIEDYPSNPKFRNLKEVFDVWFLDSGH